MQKILTFFISDEGKHIKTLFSLKKITTNILENNVLNFIKTKKFNAKLIIFKIKKAKRKKHVNIK